MRIPFGGKAIAKIGMPLRALRRFGVEVDPTQSGELSSRGARGRNPIHDLEIAAAPEHAHLRCQVVHIRKRNHELTPEDMSGRRRMGIGAPGGGRVPRKKERARAREQPAVFG
jgi:hypothetical protein